MNPHLYGVRDDLGKKEGDGVPAHSRVSGPYVVSAADEPAGSIADSETVVSICVVSDSWTTGT